MAASYLRTTEATKRAVTIEAVREYLNVDHRDDDALLSEIIEAATRYVENRCCLAAMLQTWTLTLDNFNDECFYLRGGVIWLPRAPLFAVASFQYVDSDGATQDLLSADYNVVTGPQDAQIEPAYGKSWPAVRAQGGAVTLTHTAGASDEPSPMIRQAIKDFCADRYENRELSWSPQVRAGIDATLQSEGRAVYG